jgi:hypothetical protein
MPEDGERNSAARERTRQEMTSLLDSSTPLAVRWHFSSVADTVQKLFKIIDWAEKLTSAWVQKQGF